MLEKVRNGLSISHGLTKRPGIIALFCLLTGAVSASRAAALAPWPTERTGIVFLWQTAAVPVLAFDADGKALDIYDLKPRGAAFLDHSSAMDLRGGFFSAPGVGQFVGKSLARSGEMTLEATVTPASPDVKAAIVSFTSPSGEGFQLWQEGHQLALHSLAGSLPGSSTALGPLSTAIPNEIALSLKGGQVQCSINGTLTAPGGAAPILNVREDSNLILGSGGPGTRSWKGKLEGVALFNRALSQETIDQDYKAYRAILRARKPVPQIELRVKLIARSRIKTYRQAAPYTRALAVAEYQVIKVIHGNYTGHKIRVARWAMLDKAPAAAGVAPIGSLGTLDVEPMADNPQLDSELTWDTLPVNDDMPVYYQP